MNKKIVVALSAAVSLAVFAEVKTLSPVGGVEIDLRTKEQVEVSDLKTAGERIEWLKARYGNVKKDKSGAWQAARPLVLEWTVTDGEKGPWKIELAQEADFSNATALYLEKDKPEKREGDVFAYEVPMANLLVGRTYFWRVWSDVKCPTWACGSTMAGKCKTCGKGRPAASSDVASFKTLDAAPRWIAIEGKVGNIRDLGGWKTLDGRRVRQGLAYRGQGLNYNSVNGEVRGRNRLTVEDVRYLTETLGIKTDLDLRTPRETAGMTESPLGASVKYVHHSSEAYKEIFSEKGKRTMAANFRVFCERANYPIYFHCIAGADRTGSLAYVLNGLLGVGEHDLEIDWESTFYPELPAMREKYTGPDYWQNLHHIPQELAKYGDADTPLAVRIERYLLDCGITEDEIAAFKSIMLE